MENKKEYYLQLLSTTIISKTKNPKKFYYAVWTLSNSTLRNHSNLLEI